MIEYMKDKYNLSNILQKIIGEHTEDKVLNYNLEIVLPNFQREYEWGINAQKKLLASFLVNIPIGSFLFLKDRQNTFAAKEIGYRQLSVEDDRIGNEDGEFLYLLDGQQRITALYTMFFDFMKYHIEVKNNIDGITYDSAPKPLRNRWFLDLNPDSVSFEENIFGYKYWLYN